MTKSTISPAEAQKVAGSLLKGSGQNPPGFQDDRLVEALEVLAVHELGTARKVARHLWRDGSPGDAFVLELVREAGESARFPTAAEVAVRKLRLVRLLASDWALSDELKAQVEAVLV